MCTSCRLEEAALQVDVGDRQSPTWAPFHGTDGTPNESTNDVLVRTRQVLSIMETQWQGASIIIVSPGAPWHSSLVFASECGGCINIYGAYWCFL